MRKGRVESEVGGQESYLVLDIFQIWYITQKENIYFVYSFQYFILILMCLSSPCGGTIFQKKDI